MKKVKKVIGLVNYNLKTLVGFEAIYKILTLLQKLQDMII